MYEKFGRDDSSRSPRLHPETRQEPPPPPPYVMSGVLQCFPKGETTAKEAVSTSLGLSIEYRHQTKSACLLVLIRATDNHSVPGYLQEQEGANVQESCL